MHEREQQAAVLQQVDVGEAHPVHDGTAGTVGVGECVAKRAHQNVERALQYREKQLLLGAEDADDVWLADPGRRGDPVGRRAGVAALAEDHGCRLEHEFAARIGPHPGDRRPGLRGFCRHA